MALVRFGGGVIQMSGSIAGNTYARNRYGNYVRSRTKPVNPDSERQNLVRSVIAYLTEYWAETLDAAKRDAWNAYADGVVMKNKLGEAIKLSGFNHFIRSNANVCRRGETIYDAAPTDNTLPDQDPSLRITTEVHEQRFNIYFDADMAWTEEPTGWMWILQGMPQNPQRNFFGGPYRGMKDKNGEVNNGGLASPERCSNLWVVAEGQKVWYKIRLQRADGRITEPWTVVSTVVAGPLPPE